MKPYYSQAFMFPLKLLIAYVPVKNTFRIVKDEQTNKISKHVFLFE